MGRNLKVLLSLVMVASMLAGCSRQKSEKPTESEAAERTTQASGGKKDGTDSEGGKVTTCAMQKEPEALDPIMNNYATSPIVLQNLFTNLMQIDPDGGFINGRAEKHEMSEDGLEYTFTLRDGLKWSDGSLLTADDSEYAWKCALARDTASPDAWYLLYLKNGEAYNEGKAAAGDMGIEAEDDKTLKVTLENPTAYSIGLTAITAYFPVKRDTVEGPEARTRSAGTYTSSGAFWLEEVNPQASYVLEKNPEYIDADIVKLDNANIVSIESVKAALSAYNAGEVGVMDNTIIQTQAQSQYSGSDELKSYDLIGAYYYDFNCEKDYLSDTRMRKALTIPLNGDAIDQPIVASRPESFYAFVPHGVPYEGSGEDYRTTVGNLLTEGVGAAKALMEKAGYPDGERYPTLTLITQNDQEKRDVAQAMQVMWRENLDVNVEIVTFEPRIYWNEQTAGSSGICYGGWTGDYPDPNANLDYFLL